MRTTTPSQAVQRRLEEILQASSQVDAKWPQIPEDLLAYLEGLFPPRCLSPNEMVEDHLRYAGAASLVADLRYYHDLQQGPPTGLQGSSDESEAWMEMALRSEAEELS